MDVKRIELQNFRTFELAAFDFDQPRTLLLGKNGAGKSTIVDAIAWALTGRCRGVDGRGQGQKELIRAGADSMSVELQVAGLGTVTRTLSKDGHAVSNVKTDAILAHLGVSEAMLHAAIYAGNFFRLGHAEAKAMLIGLLDVQVQPDQLPGLGLTKPANLDELEARYAAAAAARAAAKKALAAIVVPPVVAALADDDGGDITARLHEATAAYQSLARTSAAAEQMATNAQRVIDGIDKRAADGPGLAVKLKVHEEMHAEAAGKIAAARSELDAVMAEDADDVSTLNSQADEVRILADRLARHEPGLGCVLSAGIPCMTEAKNFTAHVAKLKKDAKALGVKIKAAMGRADTVAKLQQLIRDHEQTLTYHANQVAELKKAQKALDEDATQRPVALFKSEQASTEHAAAVQALDEARSLMQRLQDVQAARARHAADVATRAAAVERQQQAQAEVDSHERLVELLGPNGVRATALAAKLGDFEALINAALEPFGFRLQITVDPWRIDITRGDGSRLPFVLLSAGEQLWCSLAFQMALAVVSGLRFAVLDAAEAVVGIDRQRITSMVMNAPMKQVIVAIARADNEPAPQLPGLQVIRLATVPAVA